MSALSSVIASDIPNVFLNASEFAVVLQLTPEVNAVPGTFGAARACNAAISEDVDSHFEQGMENEIIFKEIIISAIDDVAGRVNPTEAGRAVPGAPTTSYKGDRYTIPGDAVNTWYCRKVLVNGTVTPGKMHRILIANSVLAMIR